MMKLKSLFWRTYDKLKYKKRWIAFKHSIRKNSESKRYFIINTPEHGNLGDHAIAMAQEEFFAKECKFHAIEITSREYKCWNEKLEQFIDLGDTILITGGGYLGTLWPDEEDTVIDILERFSRNNIVIMPQTAYWEGDIKHERIKKLSEAIDRCKRLTIMARERSSFDKLIEMIGNRECKIICVPDIVTYLHYSPNNKRQKKNILLCMRDDKERIDSCIKKEKIDGFFDSEYDVRYTNTVLERNVYRAQREKEVQSKLDEFANATLVITDRLHGMIFAALTGTPCIAIDNISKKVSGVYNWIQYLEYIKLVDNCDMINEKLIRQMIALGRCNYSNELLQDYYREMAECILQDSE